LQSAGIVLQDAPRRFIRVTRAVEVREGQGAQEKWARLEPYHGYKLSFEIDFDHPAVDVTGQRVCFDMSTGTGWSDSTEYYKMGIFPGFADPDLNATSSNVTPSGQFYYVDNIAYNGGVTPALPVAAVAPAHTVAASITGTAKVGKTLTAKKGTWTGTATITYAYKWYRCTKAATAATSAVPTSAAKCSAISGTAATHKLVAADKGKYIRVLVTATNTAGSAKSLSKTTAKIG